ncbi:hypothetical protein J6590_069400 [Homalodisca vitripennis]|nr:hypothetical protein J6590_069400 [Homalodisca vitripennis]
MSMMIITVCKRRFRSVNSFMILKKRDTEEEDYSECTSSSLCVHCSHPIVRAVFVTIAQQCAVIDFHRLMVLSLTHIKRRAD